MKWVGFILQAESTISTAIRTEFRVLLIPLLLKIWKFELSLNATAVIDGTRYYASGIGVQVTGHFLSFAVQHY